MKEELLNTKYNRMISEVDQDVISLPIDKCSGKILNELISLKKIFYTNNFKVTCIIYVVVRSHILSSKDSSIYYGDPSPKTVTDEV